MFHPDMGTLHQRKNLEAPHPNGKAFALKGRAGFETHALLAF